MDDLLSRLYRGEIHPEENDQPVSDKLIQARRAYLEYQEKLLAELDEQTGDKVRALLEERTILSAGEMEDSYVQGMRMGAKIAVELLEEKKA